MQLMQVVCTKFCDLLIVQYVGHTVYKSNNFTLTSHNCTRNSVKSSVIFFIFFSVHIWTVWKLKNFSITEFYVKSILANQHLLVPRNILLCAACKHDLPLKYRHLWHQNQFHLAFLGCPQKTKVLYVNISKNGSFHFVLT